MYTVGWLFYYGWRINFVSRIIAYRSMLTVFCKLGVKQQVLTPQNGCKLWLEDFKQIQGPRIIKSEKRIDLKTHNL